MAGIQTHDLAVKQQQEVIKAIILYAEGR